MIRKLSGVPYWRHDLGHCLHAAMGVLLGHYGLNPLEILGAAWSFTYQDGDVRREEYYFPCGEDSLLSALARHHPVSSRWHRPADANESWMGIRESICAGRPVAVAVDNYYLPFRPAHRDVHTNHLLVVYGFDDERDEVFVADPVPPRFKGAIGRTDFVAAGGSANPARHERDMFFTENPIGHRWLEVMIKAGMPPFNGDFASKVIARNVREFLNGARDDGDVLYGGLRGERRFLERVAERLASADSAIIDEAFIVFGVALAVTGVHGDWLAVAGRQFGGPLLIEAAREVELVAHHWAALRILLASARDRPWSAAASVRGRARRLIADHERALERLEQASSLGNWT